MDKTKKWLNKIKFMGIRGKMIFSFSVIVLTSLAIIIQLSINSFGNKLQKEHVYYSNLYLEHLSSNINDYLDQIVSVTNLAIYNHHVQAFLTDEIEYYNGIISFETQDSLYHYQMSEEMYENIINMRSDIMSISIFSENSLYMNTGVFLFEPEHIDFTLYPWFDKALEAEGKPIISGPVIHDFFPRMSESMFSVSRLIKSNEDQNKEFVILVDVNFNTVNSFCETTNFKDETQIFLINRRGDIIYTPDSPFFFKGKPEDEEYLFMNKLIQMETEGSSNDFLYTIDDEDYNIVFQNVPRTEWIAMTVTPVKGLMTSTYEMRNLLILIGLIALLVITIVIYILLTRITKPMIQLKNHMDNYDKRSGSKDTLVFKTDIHTNDEIGVLAHSFNNMIERIDQLMSQVVKDEKDKRKLELNSLQAQINPHFLYNTLDSIIWMAETNNPNIVPITESLSNFFRLSLARGKDMIHLRDELDHVRSYLTIQSFRYHEKLKFTITCPMIYDDIKVPKLILQPLVENAIYHGIKNIDGIGYISINVWHEGDLLKIRIKDNGPGISEETVKALLHSNDDIDSDGSSIGVRNVNKRIQLYFGEDYGLHYEIGDEDIKGTIVYILIPKRD